MVPVPIWTVVVALVAGLAIGLVIGRATSGRAAPAAAEPEPAPEPRQKAAPEPEPAAEAAEPTVAGTAARVDDVVAELERRVRGRRTDPEAPEAEKKPVGNGRGQQ